jgi:hypothetical protein
MKLLSNISAMPRALRWLTAYSAVTALIAVRYSIPVGLVDSKGAAISVARWWSSGSGLVLAVSGALLGVASVLTLKRSAIGQTALVCGLMGLTASIPIALVAGGAGTTPIVSGLGSGGLATTLAACYLFSSRAVNAYFTRQQ